MPKDDSTPAALLGQGGGDTSKIPLKRGDACLYCRKRRIRCSAAKPTCDHCMKLKRECVYDTGKPVSRVKQLEDKVAELEEMLLLKAGRRSSGAGAGVDGLGGNVNAEAGPSVPPMSMSQPPRLPHLSSDTSTRSSASGDTGVHMGMNPSDYPIASANANGSGAGTTAYENDNWANQPTQPSPNYDPFPGFGASFFNSSTSNFGQSSNTSAFPLFSQKPPEEVFDFSMLDPNFADLVNSFSTTGTAPNGIGVGVGAGNDTYSFSAPTSIPPPLPPPTSIPPGNDIGIDGSQGFSAALGMDGQLDTPALMQLFGQPIDTASGYFSTQPTTGMTQPVNNPPQPNGSGTWSHSQPTSTNNAPSANTSSWSDQRQPTTARYQPFVSDPSDDPTSGTTTSAISNPNSRSSYPLPTRSTQPSEFLLSAPDEAIQRFGAGVRPHDNAIGMSGPFPVAGRSGTEEMEKTRHPSAFRLGVGVPTADVGLQEDPALEGLPLVGGWFDAADLPTVARDHLLDIFFSGMKVVGQEFHIPRFLASLSLPPLRRPHPCLLYTMYLLASRASTHPPIRALESHFYSIALRQLEEAVERADRLLDATRAATMLAVYKYGLARYHEGYMMTGMAASAGLHQIPSNVFKPAKYNFDTRADLGSLMRQRAYILGPPSDSIDLGERIWAFWAVFTVDRCGAISSQWPCAIPDEIVITPYPRPLHEYELGLVSEKDNISIMSIWQPTSLSAPLLPNSGFNSATGYMFYIQALSMLERASKLMYLPPEPGWDSNLHQASSSYGGSSSSSSPHPGAGTGTGWSPNQTIDEFLRGQNAVLSQMAMAMGENMSTPPGFAPPGSSGGASDVPGTATGRGQQQPPQSWHGSAPSPLSDSGRGWTRTARVRTPKAYDQVRKALLRMEITLPPDRRTDWENWDGRLGSWLFNQKLRKEPLALHFIIGCSWMFLFDVFSFTAENTLSVNVARRLACAIQHIVQDQSWGEMDVFIAMVWSSIVKILIRETKRLRAVGNHQAAKPIESEVEVVVQALQKVGKRYNVASMQALRADRYRKSTTQETDFLKGDDFDDAVPQAG